MTLRCVVSRIFGWPLVITGLVITPMPIPLGVVFVSLGFAILVPCDGVARRMSRHLKRQLKSMLNQRS